MMYLKRQTPLTATIVTSTIKQHVVKATTTPRRRLRRASGTSTKLTGASAFFLVARGVYTTRHGYST